MSQPRIVALLGRRDAPTDGVADYCQWLGGALASHGHELETFTVPWAERGWRIALAELREKAAQWQGGWVLLQYTVLAWSRRGFPRQVPRVLYVLKDSGLRCGVLFHDFEPFPGSRLVDRFRRSCQLRGLRRLYEAADLAIFTAPTEKVAWLPERHDKAVFIPIGANCPEADQETSPRNAAEKIVAVYCVTGGENAVREVGDIGYALKRARATGPLRLVVFGRGAQEAESMLRAEFAGTDVHVETLGLLSPEDVSRTLARSDVLLFVRGGVTSRRGSALAGIACGLPVVGYRSEDTAFPVTEAGVVLVTAQDRASLAEALVRVLSEDDWREQLRTRSRAAQQQYFSWKVISGRFLELLGQSANR